MADRPSIDVSEFLGKQLEAASPDLLREMVRTFAEAIMGAEADAMCGAGFGERSDERVNSRNGYRDRPWDTRVSRRFREGAEALLQPGRGRHALDRGAPDLALPASARRRRGAPAQPGRGRHALDRGGSDLTLPAPLARAATRGARC